MKVLYLTDSLSDLDGVGRYGVRLIAALERQLAHSGGLDVQVLLARKHRPTSTDVPAHWDVSVGLPPDYFFYMTPARFWASYGASVARVARAARSADLVHAIKDYPHNLVALHGARLARKPCIATAHGTYTIQPLLDPRHARRARRTYAGFAHMISVSRYTRRRLFETLEDGALDPARVSVIPNSVDAMSYAVDPGLEEGSRPWHGKRFSLGIGEMKERKGHHLAVEAWAKVAAERPFHHHFIVGKHSDDEYESRLRSLAAAAGAEDRLHLMGNVEEAEKIDLLRRADVFLHTPVQAADGGFEGFGIVYLEASAAGTAVIGTRDSGAEDAIVDGETGALVPATVEAVADALARIIDGDELRAELGRGGVRHALASSWDDNAARVLELYREALR